MKVLSVTVATLGLQGSWREAEAQHHVPGSALLKIPGEDTGIGVASVVVKTPVYGRCQDCGMTTQESSRDGVERA